MTQDEIIEMAISNGFFKNDEGTITSPFIEDVDISKLLFGFANLVAAKVTQQEQDRCCAIVFGQCESDNVAQRTVNSIRGKA